MSSRVCQNTAFTNTAFTIGLAWLAPGLGPWSVGNGKMGGIDVTRWWSWRVFGLVWDLGGSGLDAGPRLGRCVCRAGAGEGRAVGWAGCRPGPGSRHGGAFGQPDSDYNQDWVGLGWPWARDVSTN